MADQPDALVDGLTNLYRELSEDDRKVLVLMISSAHEILERAGAEPDEPEVEGFMLSGGQTLSGLGLTTTGGSSLHEAFERRGQAHAATSKTLKKFSEVASGITSNMK